MVFDHIWIYLMVKTQMISDMRWEQIGIAKHDPKSSWLHMHTTTCIDIPDVQFLWTCQDDHGSAQVQMASAHEQSPHPSVFVVGQFSILLQDCLNIFEIFKKRESECNCLPWFWHVLFLFSALTTSQVHGCHWLVWAEKTSWWSFGVWISTFTLKSCNMAVVNQCKPD